MQSLWRKYSPFFHIAAFLITLGTIWGTLSSTVTAHESRLTAIEHDAKERQEAVQRIEVNLAMLMGRFGLHYRREVE